MCGLLTEGLDERVLHLLERLGFAHWHPALQQPSLLQGLQDFREHPGGELTVTLSADIGRGVEVHEMDLGMIDRCIDWLQQRARP
jgi:3-dehydroquinate synthase